MAKKSQDIFDPHGVLAILKSVHTTSYIRSIAQEQRGDVKCS